MDKESDIVLPRAAALIESMRAYGYSPSTAVADLIDNSISANAQNVWLTFHWNGPVSYISILDDGSGMTEEGLVEAMRPGTFNPRDDREEKDLGRFGLGLKTASFSQCRRLTVATRTLNCPNQWVRRWDLDYVGEVNQWALLRKPHPGSEAMLEPLGSVKSGTLVLLECLDRIAGSKPVDDTKARRHFLRTADKIEEHLAMVFHRYLDGPKPRLKIWIKGGVSGDGKIEPWDPFLEMHSATIGPKEEPVLYRQNAILVRTFVLPHKDRMTPEAHKKAAGPKGWNGQQGFYIYRNERMLVPGSWLNLGGADKSWTKEECYKLARIQVDIPNHMDMDWQLDVKKASATPPAVIRDPLTRLAVLCRKEAKAVFTHRGAYGPRAKKEQYVRPWEIVTRKDRNVYRINRSHPLIQTVLSSPPSQSTLEKVFRLLEETVPVEQIWLDTSENPEQAHKPFEDSAKDEVADFIRMTFQALIAGGADAGFAKARMKQMEEFSDYLWLIDELT